MEDFKLICSNLNQQMKMLKKHIGEEDLMFSFQSNFTADKKYSSEISIFCSSKNNLPKNNNYFKELVINTKDLYFNFKETEITLSQMFLNKTCHIFIQLFDNEEHNCYRSFFYDSVSGLIEDVHIAEENIPLHHIKCFLQKEEGNLHLATSHHDFLLKDGAIYKHDFPNNYPYKDLVEDDNIYFKKYKNVLFLFLRVKTLKIESFEHDYYTFDFIQSFDISKI